MNIDTNPRTPPTRIGILDFLEVSHVHWCKGSMGVI